MPLEYIPFEKRSLLRLPTLTIERLRIELSHRIHSLHNPSSTGSFMDTALCYFEPLLILDVATRAIPDLNCCNDYEYTHKRRQVITSVVEKLRAVEAVEEAVLSSPDHYCAKFRLFLGRGMSPQTTKEIWLVPIRPPFFWGKVHEGVADLAQVVDRRRLTGLAELRCVVPLNGRGRQS